MIKPYCPSQIISSNLGENRILTLQWVEEICSFETTRLESRRITYTRPSLPFCLLMGHKSLKLLLNSHSLCDQARSCTCYFLSFRKHSKATSSKTNISDQNGADQYFSEFYTLQLRLVYPSRNPLLWLYVGSSSYSVSKPLSCEYNTILHFNPRENQKVDPLETYFWAQEGEGGNQTEHGHTKGKSCLNTGEAFLRLLHHTIE